METREGYAASEERGEKVGTARPAFYGDKATARETARQPRNRYKVLVAARSCSSGFSFTATRARGSRARVHVCAAECAGAQGPAGLLITGKTIDAPIRLRREMKAGDGFFCPRIRFSFALEFTATVSKENGSSGLPNRRQLS